MAGMTITEKIFAAHCGREEVHAGEFVRASLDIVLASDITGPLAIEKFREVGAQRVFDRSRVCLIPDHYTPNKDIKSAEQCRVLREFAREQEVEHYWEVGRVGIMHALLPEQGVVVPGDLVIGADSHTCTYGALGAFSTGVGSTELGCAMATGDTWFMVPSTLRFVFHGELRPYVGGKDLILFTIGQIGVDGALYKAMEFCGETIRRLPMADRLTMCNMAIEAGAKCGIIEPDDVTRAYVAPRAEREPRYYTSDPDAQYERTYEWDVSELEPQVAFPHLPSNTKPISEARGVPIDQCVVGSCTNGRIEDLRAAAEVLRGRRVHPRVRAIIIPATQEVYRQALREGLVDIFLDAGCAVSTPTCGPCLGGHMGVLARGERAIATTNRNFVGRMGHPESEVYLSNPAVAAASAVAGEIASPEDLD